MQATVAVANKAYGPVNIGLVKTNPENVTSEFMHIVKKTHDPNLRQQGAIKLLSSVYYQYPKEFEDTLTATFALESELAQQFVKTGHCELHFEQHQQKFVLHCSVTDLAEDDAAYQLTFWHNRMFNPALPATIKVLGFKPDWQASSATPAVT